MPKSRMQKAVMWFFYTLATLQGIGFYIFSTQSYIVLQDYMYGRERLPFQERVMAAVLLRSILHFDFMVSLFNRLHGVFSPPVQGAFLLLSYIWFAIAGYFCVKLYRAVSYRRTFDFLVYPLFLCITLASYAVQITQDYAYPYDIPSLAFFTAGLYFIYTRQYLPLACVMFLGTFNRETTLFLIPIYLIDQTAVANASGSTMPRFDLSRVPWLRSALLLLIWAAVKLPIDHHFAHNGSDNQLRIRENLVNIGPKHWPGVLNICGYTIPIVLLLHRRISPRRFANYLLIVPLWIVVMFFTGVMLETRIYGELSSLATIAMLLILEDYAERLPRQVDLKESVQPG
jgi:hypothetical protein